MTQLELSVTGASLEEVVQLLHKIFSSNSMVIVQDLRELGPSKQGKGLDCRVTLRLRRCDGVSAGRSVRMVRMGATRLAKRWRCRGLGVWEGA